LVGVIAFKEALKYIENIGYEEISKKKNELLKYLDDELKKLPDIIFYNDLKDCSGTRSFNFKGIMQDLL
jgi:cysteine desulfurase/selenocysteine lyase